MDSESVITKEFLQQVLEKEALSVNSEITSFKVSSGTKPGENFLSTIYAVDLELTGIGSNDNVKRSWIIKCYPSHPSRQAFLNKKNLFYKEFVVYTQWIPELQRMQRELLKDENDIKLPYCRFVDAKAIDFHSDEGKAQTSRQIHPLENYIILEDLNKMYGYKMPNSREPLDLCHMKLAIKALAKVHSTSWAYKSHVDVDILSKFPCFGPNLDKSPVWVDTTKGSLTKAAEMLAEEGEEELSKSTIGFRDHVETTLDYFGGRIGGGVFEDLMRIKLNPKKYGRTEDFKESPWRVICHGDCYGNNMMFSYDNTGLPLDVILLDHQIPKEGCPTKDLQSLIYGSTDGPLRAQLDSLFALYIDEFNRNCQLLGVKSLPGLNLGELKYRFNRTKMLGFCLASVGLPMTLKDDPVNLEDLNKDNDMAEIFLEASHQGQDSIYRKRITEITKEMYEDGII